MLSNATVKLGNSKVNWNVTPHQRTRVTPSMGRTHYIMAKMTKTNFPKEWYDNSLKLVDADMP